MKLKSDFFNPLKLVQLALGLFFVFTGLLIFFNYSSYGPRNIGIFGKNSIFILFLAIIELAAGILYLIGLFVQIPSKVMFITSIIILIIWILYIIIGYFVNNFLNPSFLPWIQKVSLELIVLSSIWVVKSQYFNK